MTSLADVFEGRERWIVAPCDCRFGMASLPANSVDAIVCDPPYGIGFMGKEWDSFAPEETERRREQKRRKESPNPGGRGELTACVEYDRTARGNRRFQEWCFEWAREAFRVAKPGAYLLAFGGTRTYHRMTSGIEDAGWEIRDCLCWLYGSGFPKSLNVSKAIDAALGVERETVGHQTLTGSAALSPAEKGGTYVSNTTSHGAVKTIALTRSRSDEGRAAEGYGTALKPAFEPIVVARKPLDGTVAETFKRWGTGALNIDGCRIDYTNQEDANGARVPQPAFGSPAGIVYGFGTGEGRNGETFDPSRGRWPANVLLDELAAALLDEQSGIAASTPYPENTASGAVLPFTKRTAGGYDDIGGASRFFYTAKASRSERDAGLDEFAPATGGAATDRDDGTAGLASPRAGAGRNGGARNTHPTVKPVDLMRWLVRLVTRPGSLVLDPFCGSGTTGVATMREGEGRRFVGLELEPLHVDFARAKLVHVVGGSLVREVKDAPTVKPAQMSIYEAIGAMDGTSNHRRA